MKSIFLLFNMGIRIILATLLGLVAQIYLLINFPERLLTLQQWVRSLSSNIFAEIPNSAQYQAAYQFINGDQIILHSGLVLIAYLLLTLLGILFKPSQPQQRQLFPRRQP